MVTIEQITDRWKDSPSHIELVEWLVWKLSNESTSDSIPCPVIFGWVFTEKLNGLGLSSQRSAITEMLRGTVLVPRTIEPVKTPDETNRVLPCDPYSLTPDGWQITAEALALSERIRTFRVVDAEPQNDEQAAVKETGGRETDQGQPETLPENIYTVLEFAFACSDTSSTENERKDEAKALKKRLQKVWGRDASKKPDVVGTGARNVEYFHLADLFTLASAAGDAVEVGNVTSELLGTVDDRPQISFRENSHQEKR